MDSSYQQPSSKQPTQRKAHSLQEILNEFSPLTDITYKPVKVEDHREAQPLLPSTFTEDTHPFDYFILFFTRTLFNLITKNTNEYAAIHRICDGGTQDSNIKTVLFILRTIDTEEGRQ
jgi:hypothetical protein